LMVQDMVVDHVEICSGNEGFRGATHRTNATWNTSKSRRLRYA